jgi:hypothetical protein
MYKNRKSRRLSLNIAAACCVLLLMAGPVLASEASDTGSERFSAFAISLGGLQVGGSSTPSGATTVDFVVDRFSTDAERSQLLEALKTGGRDKLYRTLDRMEPVGRIQTRGSLGYDLRYAREITAADGQRILILATNRPIALEETARLSRSRKYDISVVELIVDANGNGSGTAMPAVRVDFDEATGDIVLEDLSSSPLQLTKVRKIG